MPVKFVFSAVFLNIVKVLVAVLCAGLIGLQRTKQYKLVSIQSLAFIAVGATLLMIISLTLSPGIISEPYHIASNVMIGMLLLGSVVIIKDKGSMDGIINAASIWVSAAIGLAIGAGLFLEGIFVTFMSPLFLNAIYAIVGVILGIASAIITYRLINRATHFDIPNELEKGNLAVGVVVCGIFIMIGLIVGLIIGMSLN
jgi:uncharacterized membrane protein YhiD involved in acid resistance